MSGHLQSERIMGEAPDNPGEPWYSPTKYRTYFNISTEEFKNRILMAANPMNKDFLKIVEYRPDLYGPFWIYTTLAITLAMAANMSLSVFSLAVEIRTMEMVS